MKFFRLDLLTLLISLFILSSCKNQTGIGLDPEQQLSGTMYVDTNITVNTVLEDSVQTSGLAKTPLAYINDPQIGVSQSSIAVGLNLPGGAAYTLPTGTISVDSAILVLHYASSGFYGDSLTTKYKVDVFQLTERPLSTKVYYTSKKWGKDTTNLLGTKVFNARPTTSFKITDIVTGAKDTLKRVYPQIRVPISTAFINSKLFQATTAQLASTTTFQDAIKGLYIRLDKNQINGTGGNMMLSLSDSSRIDIYYRTNDGAGTIDTAIVQMPFTTHAAEITHSYTTAVKNAIAATGSNSTFYIQGLGGLRTKVSFPNLQNIITQAGSDIILNRAELVITPAPGTTVPLAAAPKISMYKLDIAKQRTFMQDDNTSDRRYQGTATFGGYFTTTGEYHFVITGYIQDLMRGITVDYGTYLGAMDIASSSTTPTSADYLPTATTASRLVAVGTPGKTAANYPYRIRLNILYSKVAK